MRILIRKTANFVQILCLSDDYGKKCQDIFIDNAALCSLFLCTA